MRLQTRTNPIYNKCRQYPLLATISASEPTLCKNNRPRDGCEFQIHSQPIEPTAESTMDSTSHECVFLGDKLGMLFNSHGGKVTVIGLDSKQYKQSTTFPLSSPLQTTPGKSTSCEDLEKEENKKYDDAIMLSPAGKGSKKERGDEILSSASTSAKQDKIEIKEANTMTAVEMLSALANFEDGPDGIDQTETVEERTGPVAMALFDEGSPQPATEGPASAFSEVFHTNSFE
jgi:hypothetical protein